MGDLLPAAQYVRMSTEKQRYSIEFQMAANEPPAITLVSVGR